MKLIILLLIIGIAISQMQHTWSVWGNGDCSGNPIRTITSGPTCNPMEVGFYGTRCLNSTTAMFVEVCSDNHCARGCRPPRFYTIGKCYRGNEKYSQKYISCQ